LNCVNTAVEQSWHAELDEVLAHYPFAPFSAEPIEQGLINLTSKVTATDGQRYIVQRLHHVFTDQVNHNLDVDSKHLAAAGMTTPHL